MFYDSQRAQNTVNYSVLVRFEAPKEVPARRPPSGPKSSQVVQSGAKWYKRRPNSCEHLDIDIRVYFLCILSGGCVHEIEVCVSWDDQCSMVSVLLAVGGEQ